MSALLTAAEMRALIEAKRTHAASAALAKAAELDLAGTINVVQATSGGLGCRHGAEIRRTRACLSNRASTRDKGA